MFPALRAEVETALSDALDALALPTDDLGLEEPPDDVEAVLASSVAFRLASEVGAPPPQVAADVAEAIDVEALTYVERVETEGPYLNVLPSQTYYDATLEAAVESTYGKRPARDVSVVVEHTSANPTGPVHVGRARNPIIGDAVANALEWAGYDVDRHYYVNDAGRQMAVFTWAYETFDEAALPEPAREKPDYDLVRYYRAGNEFLEDGPEDEVAAAEAEIEAIMQGLEAGDETVYERVGAVVDAVLSGMRDTLDRLPVSFDEFVRETRFMRNGATDDVVGRLRELEEAVYEDDAWQLDLSAFEMEKPLVFQRSDGTSLYTTRDIAHHEWKLDTYDRAVTVIGEDHELTFTELRRALELLATDTDRLDQLFYSWVNLPGGEGMSTRAGTGIDLDDLLDEAVARARQEVEDRMDERIRDDDLDEADVERIARQVGIGAVRYDIVAKQPTKAITFEFERALDFDAQSAPYVQYVHARCCGILEEAGLDPTGDLSALAADADAAVLETPAERDLLEVIGRFPATVETAADELAPHQVATYTRTFADAFNTFYRECPVLADDVDDDVSAARLALVAASTHTIANALEILGIEAPRSM